MEQKKTHGYPKRTSGIPWRYSLNIKGERSCSKKPTTLPTTNNQTCLQTTQDEPHPTQTSTTPIESPTPPSTRKKIHNPYPCYLPDHQPLDLSPL